MIRRLILLLAAALAPGAASAADCQSMRVKVSPFGMAWEPRGFARCTASETIVQVCVEQNGVNLRGEGEPQGTNVPFWQGFAPGGYQARLRGRDMLVVARRTDTEVPVLVVRIFDEVTRCEYLAMPEKASHP
ncbi:hypothetical protein SAMN02745126_06352 [Enhydrobacter aerosaccus]|uniref:Uncharacterized protein n=1 Tax=Enhydrobacter aerosaccus TaxID=225324 RepID=A0A1T4TJE7_9HYPH|nr:hypothetical protein [Enhydrobacter aerosaccus]SKA40428.1 hypothetical protein SAMN02745126_06352 [Enhydrobacter aerosaccus]